MSQSDASASRSFIAQIRYYKSAKDAKRRRPLVANGRHIILGFAPVRGRVIKSAARYCSGYVVIRMVTPSLKHYFLGVGGVGRRVVISVRECASFAGLTPGEICLGVSPSAKHRVLQSRYLLGLWRGARTVRNLIVADIRHWLRIGDPDRAADAFIVLRQFLADFPQAQLAPVSVRSLSLRGRPRGEGRRHRSRNLSCRRVGIGPALPNISPGTISPDDMETRETAIRQPPAWRES